MKRSRKWEFVKQEAMRLADLGVGSREIAHRIGVVTTTVDRWFKAGKLKRPTGIIGQTASGEVQSPGEWAAGVRGEYSLSPTDDQLVTLAEASLVAAHDMLTPASSRLSAMRTFQGLVRQLTLVAKVVEVPAEEPQEERRLPLRPTGSDPRLKLMVVK